MITVAEGAVRSFYPAVDISLLREELGFVPSGDVLSRAGPHTFIEHFRRASDGEVDDTQYRLVAREDAYAAREVDPRDGETLGGWFGYDDRRYSGYYQVPQWGQQQRAAPAPWGGGGWFGGRGWWDDDAARRRSRRVDPDYPWGGRNLN